MAEVGKSLVDLEGEITCAVCLECYTEPKVLPCCHYFCKECILKVALGKDADKPFSCPECLKETYLPEGDVNNLQTAFFAFHLIEKFSKLKKVFSSEVKCEMCSTARIKAEAFCRQCNKFACKNCVASHQNMRVVFAGHEFVSLDDMKDGTVALITSTTPIKKCPIHQKKFKLFCFDCNGFICRDCTIIDHREHQFEFIHVAATGKKNELMDSLKLLKDVEIDLFTNLEEIRTTQHELEAQGVSIMNSINTSFAELQMILDKRRQQLLEETRRKVSAKMDNLKGQEGNMSIASAEVCGIINYTEQCVRHCTDDEVMSMHKQIGRQIKRGIEEHGPPGRITVPVEQVDIGVEVRCAEALEQLCQTTAKIVQLPVNIVVEGVASEVEVNMISEISVCITFNNHATTRNVECNLKCVYSEAVTECYIMEVEKGKYRIQYTPTVRGRHTLSISVDGQQVPGSPFPVHVFIPPADMGQRVRELNGLKSPNGVTVNSLGEIIVTEYLGDVVVLDREGNRLRSINSSQHHFKNLRGVAVDSKDNIYFPDGHTNRIFKSNRDCSKVEVHKVRQVNGPGHYEVAVVGDEVMVTECDNEGGVMVYDRDLQYTRLIVGVNKSILVGLCPDSQQHVYVCDYMNSCIEVLGKDGEFLRSFGSDKDSVLRLKYPRALCVTGQYVYVSDVGMREIVVFTTEGDYVTSLSSSYGHGVCVDQDGFVYVCDHSYSRINVY